MKKKKKFIVLIILILLISITSVTYGMYKSFGLVRAGVDTHKWSIKVNHRDITTSSQNESIIGKPNFAAPGFYYTGEITIDASDTNMPFILIAGLDYDNAVGVTKEELDKAQFTFRLLDENGKEFDYATYMEAREVKKLYLKYNWKFGDENDQEKIDADINLAQKLDTFYVPVKVIARQPVQVDRRIKFDSQGGSNIPDRTRMDGRILGELGVPTKEGYTFLGWFTEIEGGREVTENSLSVEDMMVYAHWKKDE